nr:hypothetical protein [Sphingomonas xinjiangensis]
MGLRSVFAAGLLGVLGLSTGGCAEDGYGYSGVSVGYGVADYGGYGYDGLGYDGFGYGSGLGSYFGWYGDYYYPGSGVYVYDQYRRPFRWNQGQRRYWENRGRNWRGDRNPNWGQWGNRPGGPGRPGWNDGRPGRPGWNGNGPRPGRPEWNGNGPRPGRPEWNGNGPRPGRPEWNGNGPRPGRPDWNGNGPRPGRPDWNGSRPPRPDAGAPRPNAGTWRDRQHVPPGASTYRGPRSGGGWQGRQRTPQPNQ